MPIRAIEVEWALAQFPTIFHFFRANRLRTQVEAFDEIVSAHEYRWDDADVVIAKLRAELDEGYGPILLAMSSARDENPSVGHVAAVRYMERCLAEASAAGVQQTTYREMLTSPESYLDLLGELDWASSLRAAGGALAPHALTKPDDPKCKKNYDILWEREGRVLRGDVKCFKDWLAKSRGEGLLSGHLKLLRPDLTHVVTVKARVRNCTPDQVIDTAIETATLYDAAVNQTQDPRWVVSSNGQTATVRVKAAYFEEGGENAPVEAVFVRLHPVFPAGHGSVMVIESGFTDGEDVGAVRRNCLGAAAQVPPPPDGTEDLSCVFLGSAAAADSSEVETALHGARTVSWPDQVVAYDGTGLFDPANAEPGFAHVQAVLHFSLNFEALPDHPATARAVRTCRLFERPEVLSDEQRTRLAALRLGYLRNTEIGLGDA